MNRKFADIYQFEQDLEALSKVFHSDQIRILGGEPLMHPELLRFLDIARKTNIADSIVVVTNGVLLHRMTREFWEKIDFLWLSVYPGVRLSFDEEEIHRMSDKYSVPIGLWKATDFNKSIINTKITDERLKQKIFSSCELANCVSCHTVHEGRFYRCSVAPFTQQRLALAGVEYIDPPSESVALHDNPNLFDDIGTCLNRQTPLAACGYCLGNAGPEFKARQLAKGEEKAWSAEDNSDDIDFARRKLIGEKRVSKLLEWVRR